MKILIATLLCFLLLESPATTINQAATTNDPIQFEEVVVDLPIFERQNPVDDYPIIEDMIIEPSPFYQSLNANIIYANWTNDERLYFNSINGKDSDLPVYLFESENDVNQFRNMFSESLSFASYDDFMMNYNIDFFEKNSIVLVYVASNSGSSRYSAMAEYFNNIISIEITQTNDYDYGLTNMSGWFIIVEVPKSAITNNTIFEAYFQKAFKDVGWDDKIIDDRRIDKMTHINNA